MNTVLGGDAIQLNKTKEYVSKLGVEINVSTELNPDLSSYDAVHLFNINAVKDTYIQAKNAFRQKIPIILSPIYWNLNEYSLKDNLGLYLTIRILNYSHYFKPLLRMLSDLQRSWLDEPLITQLEIGYSRQQEAVLAMADTILPNSCTEADLLAGDFPRDFTKISVIPNAADRSFFHPGEELFLDTIGIEGFVLCVARIEPRKNTLQLIKAVNTLNLPLVLIGGHSSQKYLNRCKEEGEKGDVTFLGAISHEAPLLKSAYAASRVHALVSWYETPGLSSLEAALAGSTIVSTDRGSTKEYFLDYAEYCDPTDPKSITGSIERAYQLPRNDRLSHHILKNYTWEVVAKKTLDVYTRIISK
jgi:glycosyltransferase involved in cell wall biosynthesis